MHRHDHEGRSHAGLLSDRRDQVCKSEEWRIAAAHDDGAHSDDADHHQGEAGSTKARGLGALDHGVDGAGGGEAFGEEFAGDDDGDDVRQLAAHAVKEDLEIRKGRLRISGADELGHHADGGADEHSHDDIHLHGGDAKRREDEDQRQRDHRKDSVNLRRMAGSGFLFIFGLNVYRNFRGVHGLHHVAVSLIHVFLGEVVSHCNERNDYASDGDLEGVPVYHRVEAGDFRCEDGAGVRGAPVQAQGRGDGRGSGNTRYAESDQDREHGHHEEHRQARGTIDGQAQEHAQHPAGAHDDVRRFQKHQRTDGEGNQRIAGADLIHVARKAADGHDVQAQTGHAVREKCTDELEEVEAPHAGGLARWHDGAPLHDHGAGEKDRAGDEEYSLGFVFLQNQPGRPHYHERSE